MARRAIDVGQPIVPNVPAAGSKAPCRSNTWGASLARWRSDGISKGPSSVERALAFGAAAAAACAPLVYVLVERQSAPAPDGSGRSISSASARPSNEVRKAIARAANAPFTVLIEGESGSGKELVARAIHRAGCRRERRFCALNCAAMPEDLVDAELFGHAKGAFTGAAGERLGLFESADGGTVFLDEVGELSARAQAKVLRVLQEGEIRRIGENFTRPFDARLVAATNRPLARRGRSAAGFGRTCCIASTSFESACRRCANASKTFRCSPRDSGGSRPSESAAKRCSARARFAALARYDWPGNVRELQNVLTALVVAAPPRGVVGASELPAAIARAAQPDVARVARARAAQVRRAVRARGAGARGRPPRADGGGARLQPAGSGETDAAPPSRCLGTSSAGCC